MFDVVYYMEEGLKKLKDELYYMKIVQWFVIFEQIVEVCDKGDFLENVEYDVVKEVQGFLEMKILKMEDLIVCVCLIDDFMIDILKVFILLKVKICNVINKVEMEYMFVVELEVDVKVKKILVELFIGKGLFGKFVGEVVEIQMLNGVMKFEIVDISW